MSTTKTSPERPSKSRLAPRPTVNLIGIKAGRYLSTPGFSGEVISVGERAAYIATDEGDILAACRDDQQPHPRSFLTDLDLSNLHVGLRTWVEGTKLWFSNGVSLPIAEAQRWSSGPRAPVNIMSLEKLRSRCGDLLRAAIDLHEGDDLGLSLPFLINDDGAETSPDLQTAISPLTAAGVELIRGLLPHRRSGDLESVLKLAEQLIGLGPGLTPSGDDFVGGLVFMSRRLSSAYPEERWWEGGDLPALLAYARSNTSRISYALLTDLFESQSHASLHALAHELISDTGGFDAKFHVRQVTQIGHSSGWDMLTGILAALLPVFHRDMQES
jgi:hypothetical protein